MADLKAAEVERAREHFEIYDFEGEGKIDAKDLGDLLRSLDCKPTLAMVKKNGGSEKKGDKKLTLEEFLPIFSQIRKEKEIGTLEDFMEGLKVYDKAENGTMLAAELAHVLLSLETSTSSDFWLFPKLKDTLKGQHFSSDAEVDVAVRKWIKSKPQSFFMDGMKKCLEKCVAVNGERLTDIECEEIMRVCDEDDDGFLKYEPFVKTVMAGPFPEENK